MKPAAQARPATVVLLVGHGSRETAGNDEIHAFAARWQAKAPQHHLQVCFIEHAEVLLDAGLAQAAATAGPGGQVLLLPLILSHAGHIKDDLPAALAVARAAAPAVDFRAAPPLGLGEPILALLHAQWLQAMARLDAPDPQSTGVILLARGSSDREANAALAQLARLFYEDHEHELVDIAFTGVTWPRLESVVARQVRLGMQQVLVLPVYLFSGVLSRRIDAQLARLTRQFPQTAFGLGGLLGGEAGLLEHAISQLHTLLGEKENTEHTEHKGNT